MLRLLLSWFFCFGLKAAISSFLRKEKRWLNKWKRSLLGILQAFGFLICAPTIMKLIIGLGNPGIKYAKTRHNVGFRIMKQLAKKHDIKIRSNECQARTGKGIINGEQVILSKPMTFMNLSGIAVRCLALKYSISCQDMLIIYDDIDLKFGQLRFRPAGGDGGHKGMKSIIQHLGTTEVPRFRFGVGRPITEDVNNYVLAPFAKEESRLLPDLYTRVLAAIELYLKDGAEGSGMRLNGQTSPKTE